MNPKQTSAIKKKRVKSGHERTPYAICLICFEQFKKDLHKKFWFTRFNSSTQKDHMKAHDCSNDFVSFDDPRAVEAKVAFQKLDNRCVSTL